MLKKILMITNRTHNPRKVDSTTPLIPPSGRNHSKTDQAGRKAIRQTHEYTDMEEGCCFQVALYSVFCFFLPCIIFEKHCDND